MNLDLKIPIIDEAIIKNHLYYLLLVVVTSTLASLSLCAHSHAAPRSIFQKSIQHLCLAVQEVTMVKEKYFINCYVVQK